MTSTPPRDAADTRTLIERSSLGEPGAVQLRRRTSHEHADAIVRLANTSGSVVEQSHRRRAEVLHQLRTGEVTLVEVLDQADDDAVGKLRVAAVLQAMPHGGPDQARQIMEELRIAPSRRLRGLGTRQRSALRALENPPAPAAGAERTAPEVVGLTFRSSQPSRWQGRDLDLERSLERSRLLLAWLQARRRVDSCLSELLGAGPAGERRVREQLTLVDSLERDAQVAFDRYRAAVGPTVVLPTDPVTTETETGADYTRRTDRPAVAAEATPEQN